MIENLSPIVKYFTCFYYLKDEDFLREAHFDDEEVCKKFVLKAFFDREIYLVEVVERYVYGCQRFKASEPMPLFSFKEEKK